MNYPAGGGSTTDTSSQMAHLEHIEAIERRLWNTAGTLLANSNYASNEYFLVGLSDSADRARVIRHLKKVCYFWRQAGDLQQESPDISGFPVQNL